MSDELKVGIGVSFMAVIDVKMTPGEEGVKYVLAEPELELEPVQFAIETTDGFKLPDQMPERTFLVQVTHLALKQALRKMQSELDNTDDDAGVVTEMPVSLGDKPN